MTRIALFLPNWIGDVVMATPAVRAVRAAFPDAELIAVCKPYVADVLAGAPWFTETVLADKRGPRERRLFAVAGRLRAKPLDAALLFPNSFRTALLAYLGGAKRIVGFRRYARGVFLTDKLQAKTDPRGRFVPTPALDDYNRLARALGTGEPGHRMELFTTPADEAAAAAVWERFDLHRYPRVVALNPGAAFGAAKHWGSDHFAELARGLSARLGCGVLVVCGPGEREMARRIADESRSPHVFPLSDGPLSLGLTKALVRRADLLVTTDSGPRHFAAAFDRPVVSLFGPTHIEWTETYFAREICLQKKLPCGPCQQRVCPLGHHRCMRELAPAEVFAAADRLLTRVPLAVREEVPRAA
ncbi:lipopolysaccharide heptosyltransferase II [Frigoriglobus tundricola]|uniref:lipopolysaccharide heptosyltransferase II n=1 Tax=Frigoriglobus tundricola TaxID=2774151 RepID=A0A6M5YI28_9BACT|nr:lipopolysaccharide heptosyltransferase II [Frigoriglobus tundricola]QJW92981.1 ADP-heptose--lipooligosaccharide heptosyltransferase II [Frigoriglobus tundricola]